jgi:hypothetical protein
MLNPPINPEQACPSMNGFYWLASYPKSGNTWMRLFLESLVAGDKTVDINEFSFCGGHVASRAAFDRILDIESADLTDDEIALARPRQYEIEAKAAKSPMLRKVHDAWGLTSAGEPLFPPELTLGAVYLVRDPRDVAVSLAHHNNLAIDWAITHMGNSLAMMESPSRRTPQQLPQRIFGWSDHVESWLTAPVRLLTLKYEDMLAEPVAKFGEVARFLGLDATQDMVAAAVSAVHFEQLRAAEETVGFAERPPGMERFFRRGIAGGWQDSLTPDQVARIETAHGSMMRKLGYL